MKKLLFVAMLIASALGSNLYAQSFDTNKTYVISNRNDATIFMQDNGTGIVAAGSKNSNSYWYFESTGKNDCYYVRNASTGNYMQSTKTSEEAVATGTTPVEICVLLCEVEGDGMYGFASTDQSTYNFTSGTIGANWDNARVQGYAAVAGTNHKSFWKVVEEEMPEPEVFSSPWQGNAVAQGTFYLYNVESGLWLQNNDSKTNDWSTRAAIGTRGLDIAFVGSENAYTLGANFGKSSINPDNNYLDTNNNPAWTFEVVEKEGITNAYKIYCGNKVLGTVRYNESGKQNNLFTQTGDERWYLENPDHNINMSERNTWQLVTKEERLGKMKAEADLDNPVDASWLIPSADFANNDQRYNQWTRSLNGGNGRAGDGNGINGSMCIESWKSNNIDFSITINDIPNGTYRMTVQGYYRDGNVDEVVARRDAGTETIRSYYFANEVSHPLMSILDEAKDAKVDGAWDTQRSGRWYPDSQNSANKCFNIHKGYVNPEIEVVVTTKSLKIGIEKKEGVGSDWTVFDNFKLTYLGNHIDLTEYVTALNNALTAAKAINQDVLTAAAKTALSTAISDGEAALTSEDGETMADATSALTTITENVKDMDITVLSQTIALAEAEGIDVTEANNTLENATTSTQVNNAVNTLRIVRRVVNAETHADVFTGNAPAAGDYYLFNVGTGRFFCGGDDWGAHAALGFPGIIVTLEEIGENYKIDTHLKNGDALHYLNYGGYCDTQTDDTWAFIEVSTGVYNIARSGDNNLLLGYSAATYNRLDTDKNGADNPNNQWKLVTKADRDALLATATDEAPQDASYLIKSPGFSQREDVSAWTFTNASIWGRGGNHPDFAIESFDQTSATVEQTVTGLPAGTYELKVQAFYRDGNFGTQVNILSNGGEARQLATLYAGTKSALIQNVYGGADMAPGMGRGSSVGYMPDGIDDACLYFQSGLYWATLDEIVVGQDGTMTIGARKTEKLNNGDWMVLDNFRLIYKGASIDLSGVKADLLAKIGEATTLLNNLNLNLSFLATAKTNGQNVYDNSTDADEIVAATNALQTAINQANAATDMTLYKQTVALAETEGIDTNTSKATLEGVTDGSTFASVVSSELNNVRTARRLNAVDKQPDIFTGSAPEDGGQYYIYNVGAQRYLTGGVDYGTHAAVNYAAQIATFTQNGEGWRIHTNIRTNSDALNHNGFVDCGGDGDTWYLIEVSTGVYNISRTNSNTDATLLGYSGERRGNWWQVDTDNQGADQAINQWKLVTKAERDALMAYASEENPVDATYYIHAAGFDHHLPSAQLAFPLTQWQTWFPEGKGGNNGIGGWEPDFNWEAWNAGNIKFFQELKDLPAGKYRLTAQAYYRHGNFEQAVSEFDNPKTDGAILYATNGDGETAQSYIVPITSEVNKVPGYGRSSSVGSFPDDRNETAAQFFEAGLYKNVVNDIIVTADGKLTIGIEKFENSQPSEWIVADNFRLTCLGLTPTDNVTVSDALYATYVAPCDVDFTGAEVSAFAAQVNIAKGYVHLEPVTTVPAGTAVVVKANAAGTYAVTKTTGATLGKGNDLIAATEEVTADGSQYVLAKPEDNEVGFYKAQSGSTIKAGKAYLQIQNAGVKAFYFEFDDETGIAEIENGKLIIENSIYNVAGQKLSKTQKGINIVNGKKILK